LEFGRSGRMIEHVEQSVATDGVGMTDFQHVKCSWSRTARVASCSLGVCSLGPGRSRDYSLELPQIRTCALNASGSSRCGIAVPHTTGWFRGDTLMRHDVLGVVPTPRPQRGTPFAPRGPGGPFPRFNTTMGRCDSLPSISPRFVSFAWRYQRFVPCSSPPARDKRAVDQPGVGKPGLQPAVTMETARSPKFPRNPLDHSPCSFDPGVTRHADGSRCR